MGCRSRALLVVLALVAVAPAPAQAQAPPANKRTEPTRSSPSAQARIEARQHYDNGARKFDLGKYDEAAEEFQRAYELVGDPVILFNIAQSFRLAQSYEKAILFYRNFLRRSNGLSARERGEVERRIDELNDLVRQQKKASETPPTGIAEPPRAPPVTPPPPEATTPPPAAPAATATPPAPDHASDNGRRRTLRIVGFTTGALALGCAGAAGAMAGLASAASGDVEAAARRGEPFTPALADRQNAGHTYDNAAIGLWVGAGVLAAGSAVLLYFGLRPQPERRVAVAPTWTTRGAGLVVSGSF